MGLCEQNGVLITGTKVPFYARNNHFEQKSLKILENQIDMGGEKLAAVSIILGNSGYVRNRKNSLCKS